MLANLGSRPIKDLMRPYVTLMSRAQAVISVRVLRRFQENLQSTGVVPTGARVLVGFSGGADSTCLLDLLAKSSIDVVAAHLHHGQRPEADQELEACAKFADDIGVPFVSGKVDVPALARDQKKGLEEAGRIARYRFFSSAKDSTGCQLVATAHTLDDHVETIVFNLARGTGLSGLAGIPQKRDDIVRPLLDFTRLETRAYCQEHGLNYHDDPANTDLVHSRTRIRMNVLPELEKVNSDFRRAVQRLSIIAAEDDDLLNGIATSFIEQNEVLLNAGLSFLTRDCEIALRKQAFSAHPKPVTSRAVRLIVEALGGQLDFASTRSLLEALKKEKGSWTPEGGTMCAEWDRDVVHFRILLPDVPQRMTLKPPGTLDSPVFGWSLIVEAHNVEDYLRKKDSLDVVVDGSQVQGDMYVRTAQRGESVQPLGMSGTKLLSDLFQEHGLTGCARKRLPIVCDFVGPVWIPGICLVERVKITEHSSQGLRLMLKSLSVLPA